MSQPILLQNLFSGGMRRDVARNRMSPGSAWNLRDIIVDYDAPARERAGWANASPSITSLTAGVDQVQGGVYAIFSKTAGESAQNLAIAHNVGVSTYLVQITSPTSATLIGAGGGVEVNQNPVFHGGVSISAATAVYTGLVIIPYGESVAPYKYDGTTLSTLNGSPPNAHYAVVFKNYTSLGNGKVGSTVFPNRVWFSPAGDPDCFGTTGLTAWDTTDSWIDFSVPVIGLAATKNVMLVFGHGQISRIVGSIAPPDSDMTVDDPWQKLNLLDARSITHYQDSVYFCASEGVFRTDGVSLDDITLKGGMLRYWLDIVKDADSDYIFSTGIVRNKLMISVLNGNTFVDGFMIDLTTYAWTRVSNLDAISFWSGLAPDAPTDETYFARANAPIVGATNSMFANVGLSGYVADGDGTVVTSVIETPFYEGGGPGLKVWRQLYCGYNLDDLTSANPTIAVSYVDTPEETSYTALGTLSETDGYSRLPLYVGDRRYGLAFKFARAGAGDFWGFDLMADVSPLEGSMV